MSTHKHNLKYGVARWLVPALSVGVTLVMFASCATEDRNFNPGGDGDGDAAVDAGETTDSGPPVGNECEGQDDGTSCGAMSGFLCVDEACRESSCGDGYVDEDLDEECDDGNQERSDGCEPECTFTCQEDADCDDANPCNGEESCDADHLCLAGDAPDTTLQVPCTLPLPPVVDAGMMTPVDAGSGDSGTVLTDSGVASDAGDAGDAGPTPEPVDPTAGFCRAGQCVPAGCGNGIVQTGEECDDFNSENADGCRNDCTFTCETDAECDDYSVCTGAESCDTDTHTCLPGDPLDCDDDVECTENDCDALLGCLNSLIDEDEDGHASEDLGDCGDDCDDADGTTYTDAAELCGDDIDNDCDGDVDESVPLWYLDCDGDDYAQQGASSTQACNEPDPQMSCSGWTTRIPIGGDLSTQDCFDSNPAVHPNRNPDDYSTTAVPGKATPLEFDWNCNGTEDKEPIATSVTTTQDSCSPNNCYIIILPPYAGSAELGPETSSESESAASGMPQRSSDPGAGIDEENQSSQIIIYEDCCGPAGYTAGFQPACGVAGNYTYCSGFGGCHRVTASDRVQACR